MLVDSGFLASDFTALLARPLAAEREVPPGGFVPATRLGAAALATPRGAGATAREIAALEAELAAMRSSRVWRLAQALRGLFGRRW